MDTTSDSDVGFTQTGANLTNQEEIQCRISTYAPAEPVKPAVGDFQAVVLDKAVFISASLADRTRLILLQIFQYIHALCLTDLLIADTWHYKKIIAVVFKANVSTNPELFNRLIVYLPELRKTRKNIQYLADEEINEVKRTLAEPNSGLSLRDKAIGTLALYYGLR